MPNPICRIDLYGRWPPSSKPPRVVSSVRSATGVDERIIAIPQTLAAIEARWAWRQSQGGHPERAVRLCWSFVPDELSAFASKKPNG
jgi:hypothetical protein